ncbi:MULTISPECIES: SGNH/GDSL hydrolase family protein [Paenibacillus]|uniref:SGNH/GDSL hydrolase family protein n=1 Tax=Paenibacillus TaxID=44249 RepID=UPI001F2F155A|nr:MULTISPECIES: SGNH/GDSL hydrolase family protein [Paenibacillus]
MTHIEQPANILRQGYAPATVLSSAANYIMNREAAFTRTFRTYVRVRETGPLHLKFWHGNSVDSTWDQGKESVGGEPGGEWRIEAAYVADGGTNPDGGVAENSQMPITFNGVPVKNVAPGEKFWSDEVDLELPEGHFLAFTWTITATKPGKSVPYNVEQNLASAYEAPGNRAADSGAASFKPTDNLQMLPSFIGYRKKVSRNLVFFGDSITQGVRTARDRYEFWAARIAEGLGPDYGVWNLGSGWARSYDASAGKGWLDKAAEGDEIVIVLGVNDLDIGCRTADELLGDLKSVIDGIKRRQPGARIILGTVPPFNFTGEREAYYREVNRIIRETPPEGADRIFDIAAVLAMPAPEENRIRPGYMSGKDDPHPNGLAGAAVAQAFLDWY